MADSATTIARLRNQEEGGNDGLWGQYTDINLTLLEDLAAGVLSKDISGEGNITLTSTNFVADEARHAVLELTGTLTNIRYVVVPNSQKTYFINNKTGNEFKVYVKTSSGSAVEIAFGKDIVYCDGNNVITTLLGASLADTITQVNNGTLASVASSLAAIEGVNTNKDNITTVSSINGAISQVASNATNINAAANNQTNIDLAVAEPLATNISSVADNSSNINLVAGAKTNVDLVAGQISPTNNISTVAGVSSAVSSVASKVDDVTSFNLVYHGAASSDPSTRSGGSSLVAGDLYFNSSDNVLKVYSGSAWQAAALDASAFATSDADLDAIAALSHSDGNFIVSNGSTYVAESGATARTSLGLGTIATQANDSVNIDGGAIDGTAIGANSASTIVGTTITANTSLLPDASGGADIGSATAEWGDIYIADDKQIKFGNDQDVTMEYDEDGTDTLLITGNTTLADGSYNLNIASHDGTNGLALAGTVVTTTAAELNLIDGGTARGTTAVASGDGILINDGGTMLMTDVDTVSTYFSSHNVGGGNIVTTGALDSGSITSGFGAIDNGTSGIRTNTVTVETSLLPDASGGADIGSATAEFGDVYIADDKQIKFGSDQDVTMEYDEDGTDSLLISGGDVTIADDKKLYFGTNQDVYLEYDEDGTDKLIIKGNTTFLDGSYDFDIASHDGTNGLKLGGTIVSATAAQLNYTTVSSLGTTEASKAVTADANGVVTFDNGKIEESTAITSSSNAATINLRDGDNFTHTLSENVTYTFSNPAANGKVSAFTLKVTQDSSARTITWPNSVDWGAGTAPTLSTGNAAVDVFVFVTYDGGTIYYGFTAGQAMA